MESFLLICVIVAAFGAFGATLDAALTRRKLKQALESGSAQATEHAERAEQLERLLEEHVELHGERDTTSLNLAERLREAVAEAKHQESRALRYFECIARIEVQRDYWQKRYHEQARGHSAAQSMMMGEIDRLCRRLHRHEQSRKPEDRTQIDPALREAHAKFVEDFVDPGTAHADPPSDPPALSQTDATPD